MPSSENPDDFLPLTPRVFLILWALSEEECHGYGLLRRVEELGRGRVSIKPGSLYEAIASLARRGLIEPTKEPGGDSRRHTYRITSFGRNVVVAEATRLDELVEDLHTARLLKQPRRS